ncbi:MAG TPA: ZIP family metal transporter [archaeon]|nr:ZIP family metal transporter [archaeon]
MEAWIYAIGSVLLVSAVSIVGVLLFPREKKGAEKFLIYMVSFAAGALFGDAFIHLLPEAAEMEVSGTSIGIYVLCGIVFSFIVEKFIRWRHCHVPTSHDHPHPVAMMNLLGDVFHNFIDGIIIAASYLVSIPLGIATTIAVLFHEIPQEIGDFGVLLHGGFTRAKAIMFNFLVALTAVAGAAITLVIGSAAEQAVPFLVPFAAGVFIYIAGSDLIPELHKDEANFSESAIHLLWFVLGIGVMLALLLLE